MMRYLIVTICLLLMVVPVAAQDNDGETIALSGAFNITVPDHWEIDKYRGAGYYWETADSSIRIRTYSPRYQVYYEAVGVETVLELLVTDSFNARSLDTESIETMQFGDYEGTAYTFEEISEGVRYLRTIYLYQMENDFIVAGHIKPLTGYDLNDDDVQALHAAMLTVTLQDTFEFFEGTRLEIPEGWQLIDDQNEFFGRIALTNGDITFTLTLWPSYGAITGLEDPADFMAYFADPYFSDIEVFTRSKLEETTIAGFEAMLFPFSSVETVNEYGIYDRAVITFTVPTNNSAFAVWIMTESLDEPYDEVFEILDRLEPGTILLCAVFSDPGDRLRAEPTTSSELVRQTDDENLIAVRQFTDDAGYIWFDVREGWIRSDVVFFDVNACANIPVKR